MLDADDLQAAGADGIITLAVLVDRLAPTEYRA